MPRFERINMHGNGLRQRVSYIGCRNAVCMQQISFKGENAQQMVYTLFDFLNALGAPGPNGRTYKMHSRNASLL